jgi:hypothetical protein
MSGKKPDAIVTPLSRRDDSVGNVDSLAAVERRIVQSIGHALRRLEARMQRAEQEAEETGNNVFLTRITTRTWRQ